MLKLLVGTVVWKRGWALPSWFAGVEAACEVAGVEPMYAFVGDPRDTDSFGVIDSFLDEVDREAYISWVEEQADTPTVRVWNNERYHRMVYLRNSLLELVRQVGPDYFLSVDSDIVLHPDVVVNLLHSSDRFDAVGGKLFMSPTGRQFPSFGWLPGLTRHDESSVFPVDVIMALKLLSPDAYCIDYEFDPKGEDIGFCNALRRAGLSIGWDGRVCSKHLMEQQMVNQTDERCGF